MSRARARKPLPSLRRLAQTLLLLLSLSRLDAHAQATSADLSQPTPQTISPTWRVHPGDDPAYASPNLDDTAWPLMQSAQSFTPATRPPTTGGFFWVRLHLHLANSSSPAAFTLTERVAIPFEVYANGLKVAESPGFTPRVLHKAPAFPIPLPQSTDQLIANRIYHPPHYFVRELPPQHLEVGPLSAIRLSAALINLRSFDEDHTAEIVWVSLCFGMCLLAVVLFLAQRHRLEYLWLALFCLFYASTVLVKVRVESGTVSAATATMLLYRYLGCLSMISSVEFVLRFAQVVRQRLARILQVLFLLIPLLGLAGDPVFLAGLLLCMASLFVLVIVQLLAARRRGIEEVSLLLPFLLLLVVVDTYYFLSVVFPESTHFPSRVHVGHVGIGLDDLAAFFFLLGVVAVVLHRFIRVNGDEEVSLAEFEAARTVQKGLIPDFLPNVPGYTIASAFQPAQVVGGDFFQVIPLPATTSALVILGDVSGKGLQAAMTVALIIGTLRTLVEYTQSPRELMAGLNRRLLDRGPGHGFTTCVILRLEADGLGCLCNAGHLAPYRDAQELPVESSIPLGIASEVEYFEAAITLDHGQTLTLLTDGVVEARDPRTRELFGFARTLAISSRPALEIAAEATRFGRPAPPADDITVLTIARA